MLHSIQMPLGQHLEIVQTDITALTVDAVVNPTNSTLYMGGMVGSRLMEVGGSSFAKVMADARTNVSNLQKNEGKSLSHVTNHWVMKGYILTLLFNVISGMLLDHFSSTTDTTNILIHHAASKQNRHFDMLWFCTVALIVENLLLR